MSRVPTLLWLTFPKFREKEITRNIFCYTIRLQTLSYLDEVLSRITLSWFVCFFYFAPIHERLYDNTFTQLLSTHYFSLRSFWKPVMIICPCLQQDFWCCLCHLRSTFDCLLLLINAVFEDTKLSSDISWKRNSFFCVESIVQCYSIVNVEFAVITWTCNWTLNYGRICMTQTMITQNSNLLIRREINNSKSVFRRNVTDETHWMIHLYYTFIS